MHRKMQMRVVLAVGGWAILAVALAQQGHAPRHHSRMLPTADERIDNLQYGFQAAMDDISMTKLQDVTIKSADGSVHTYKRAPVFGLQRTTTFTVVHDGVVRNTMSPTFGGVQEGSVDFYAVSSLGKPLRLHRMTLHKDIGYGGSAKDRLAKEIVAFADKAWLTSPKDISLRGKILGDDAETRPLRLSKPECLPCHQDSKVGDPLAILVCILKKGSH